jgi:transcriptional regulator with PAS, ATPase and Fis domain
MDISLQAKLLRVLQEKEIVRVGSNKAIKTDCRIIVATNRNLQEEVMKGTFRQDLYYRLFGLSINLPPLRERENDIIILSKHFIAEFCEENNLPVKTLSKPAVDKLLAYSFPGNIRELKSVIELAITVSDEDEISGDNIMLGNETLLSNHILKEMTLREYNLKIVKNYLEKYDNNIKLVAEKLDLGVATIYRMLKEKESD